MLTITWGGKLQIGSVYDELSPQNHCSQPSTNHHVSIVSQLVGGRNSYHLMMFHIAVIKKVWLLLVAVGVWPRGVNNQPLLWMNIWSPSGGWEYNSEKEVTRPGKRLQETMENHHHAINGKTHYFDWAMASIANCWHNQRLVKPCACGTSTNQSCCNVYLQIWVNSRFHEPEIRPTVGRVSPY